MLSRLERFALVAIGVVAAVTVVSADHDEGIDDRALVPRFESGEAISAAEINHNFNALELRIAELEEAVRPPPAVLRVVGAGADPENDTFATIHDALASIAGKRIPPDGSVTIEVEGQDGPYEEPIFITHPDGARLRIIGVPQAAAEVVTLSFSGDGGVRLEDGAELGELNRLELVGSDVGDGISAADEARIRLGNEVIVRRFQNGYVAIRGASIYARETRAAENGSDGYVAREGGRIDAQLAQSENNLAAGFHAANGSFIDGRGSTAHNTGQSGYVAAFGSVMIIDGCRTESPDAVKSGVTAGYGSVIMASNCNVAGHLDNGFVAHRGSTVIATNAQAHDNDGNSFAANWSSYIDAGHSVADPSDQGSPYHPSAARIEDERGGLIDR